MEVIQTKKKPSSCSKFSSLMLYASKFVVFVRTPVV